MSAPGTQPSGGWRHDFVTNVMIVSGGSVAGQAISLVTAPIVARLFAPAAFGLGAIYATVCLVFAVIGCLRYESAVLLPKEPADGAAVLGVSLVAALMVAALTGLGMAVAGDAILRLLGADVLLPYAWIVPVGILLTALDRPLAFYFQRCQRFGTVAAVRLAAILSGIVCVILVGLMGWQTGRDLIFARTATVLLVVPLAMLLLIALRPADVAWAWPGVARMRAVAWRYRHFPLVNSWAAILNGMALQAPPLVLAVTFSPAIVGFYAMAQRLVGLPAEFVSVAVAQVFFQRVAAERARGETAAVAHSVQQVAEKLTALGVLPVLLIALLGPPLVSIVFGERWADAGLYVALLAPVTFSMFITSPMTVLVNVLEKHRFNVVVQSAMLVLRVGALWGGAALWGAPEAALGLYAAVVPPGLLVQQTVLLRASGARPSGFFAHLARHLCYALPCVTAWLLADRLLGLPYAAVALATLLGAVPYVLLAAREDPLFLDVARELVALLRARLSR